MSRQDGFVEVDLHLSVLLLTEAVAGFSDRCDALYAQGADLQPEAMKSYAPDRLWQLITSHPWRAPVFFTQADLAAQARSLGAQVVDEWLTTNTITEEVTPYEH